MEHMKEYLIWKGWKKDLDKTLCHLKTGSTYVMHYFINGLFPFDKEEYERKHKKSEKLRKQVRELEKIDSLWPKEKGLIALVEAKRYSYVTGDGESRYGYFGLPVGLDNNGLAGRATQ
jgi:hypothetical protein